MNGFGNLEKVCKISFSGREKVSRCYFLILHLKKFMYKSNLVISENQKNSKIIIIKK